VKSVADACNEVESRGSIVFPRTAAIGADLSLLWRSTNAKDCPTPAVRNPRRDRLI